MEANQVILMDQTVTHIFKTDASKLEDTMSRGYDRKTTDDGNVYFVIQTNEDTKPPSKQCYPTTFGVTKLNNNITS